MLLPSIQTAVLSTLVSLQTNPPVSMAESSALEEGCSSVFGDETDACSFEEPDGSYDVLVSWSEDAGALVATIEVTARQTGDVLSRELRFQEHFGKSERWESIGLVVAALVNTHLSKARSRPPPPEPKTVEPAAARREPIAPEEEFDAAVRLGLGGTLLGGPGDFVGGGGVLRATSMFRHAVRPTGALSLTLGDRPVQRLELRPALGLRYFAWEAPLVAGLSLEAVASFRRYRARRGGTSDQAWSTRAGVSWGGFVDIPLGERSGLSLGGAVTALFPSVEVLVEDQRVTRISPVGYQGNVGFWLDL